METSKTRRVQGSRPEQSLNKSVATKANAQEKGRPSKKDSVIALLQRPEGATIKAMMKATGWQSHSVRGFLAGTVCKRIKLKLASEKLDGERIYRLAPGRKVGAGGVGEKRSARVDHGSTAN